MVNTDKVNMTWNSRFLVDIMNMTELLQTAEELKSTQVHLQSATPASTLSPR